jgi:hypothetical protein
LTGLTRPRDLRCRHCAAVPGEPCAGRRGQPLTEAHPERREDARQARDQERRRIERAALLLKTVTKP